ncbi:MAG: glycosyltransferase, partial [Muribaculaceae bacterium]|nr:glycosyltransferase [Muribaculaceae bacterium]
AYADRGLSVNRNHSLNDATAPYVLISDDDLEYSPEGLMAVIGRFDADPDLALATFRSATQAERVFPPDGHDLAVPFRNYYAISVEIALRRDAVERFGLRFSPLAGIGAPELIAGEEDLFVHHAIISGCRARYFDIMIARHAGSTTAERQSGRPELVRTKGAVLTVVRGVPGSLMRFPLEAARCGGPWLRNCGLLLGGMFYALKHRQEL